MNSMKWVEREFNFDFPVELFPCILERVRGTPSRVEEIARSYAPGILTIRVGNGWSIQEQVGHLLDLDDLHEARLEDYALKAKVLRPADMTNKKTSEANHNAKPIDELLRSFRQARGRFVKRLEEMDDEMLARIALHPRLQKPMRMVDMAFFVAEHDDHHLASITRLARML